LRILTVGRGPARREARGGMGRRNPLR